MILANATARSATASLLTLWLLASAAPATSIEPRAILTNSAPTQDLQRSEYDSSGVQIVEFTNVLASRVAFRISENPIAVVGPRRGDVTDFERGSATRLANGDLAVRLSQGQRDEWVGIFDSTGRGKGRLGNAEYIRQICTFQGDTIVTIQLNRLSVFSPENQRSRSIPTPSQARVLCPARGARYLVIPDAFPQELPTRTSIPPTAEIRRPMLHLQHVAIDQELRVVHDLGRFPGIDFYQGLSLPSMPRLPGGGYRATWNERPFGRYGSFAAEGDRVHIGDGTSWEIRTLSTEGRLLRILRVRAAPLPVTAALRSAYSDAHWASRGGASRQAHDAAYRVNDNEVYPSTIPPYREILTDAQGRLWVRRYPLPDEQEQEWFIFTREAQLLGRVLLPGALMLLEPGENDVICLALTRKGRAPSDPPSLHEVRLYRLLPG